MSALNTFDGKHLLLGAILALGAFVRLSGLDVGWFLQDQARDAMAAQSLLSGRDFPLVGPHAALSTVQLVGPLYYYLVAIPYGLSANPVIGIAFLNVLGVLSISHIVWEGRCSALWRGSSPLPSTLSFRWLCSAARRSGIRISFLFSQLFFCLLCGVSS
jgi:hypothetical protein